MSYAKKNSRKVLGSIVVILGITAIAVWQFYRFVTFTNEQGVVDLQLVALQRRTCGSSIAQSGHGLQMACSTVPSSSSPEKFLFSAAPQAASSHAMSPMLTGNVTMLLRMTS